MFIPLVKLAKLVFFQSRISHPNLVQTFKHGERAAGNYFSVAMSGQLLQGRCKCND